MKQAEKKELQKFVKLNLQNDLLKQNDLLSKQMNALNARHIKITPN